MAYPDYSIVIISVTANGVTTDYASAFYNEQLAQKFYDKAISEGKRAFYFEKPTPSKFARNDAQPLKQNTEAGLENAPVPSLEDNSQPVQSLGEIAEEVYNSAEKTFTDAVGTIRTFQRFQIEVAKKYFDTFHIGPFKFFRKVFNRIVNEPAEVVVAIEIITNKKITVKHDGNGGFNIVVEKLFPDKGETLLDDGGQILITLSEVTSVIVIGQKQLKKVFGGASISDFVSTVINNYIAEGTIVYETDYKIYRSDGSGWVTVENKEQDPEDPEDPEDPNPPTDPGCPDAGLEFSRNFIQDLVYPIVTDTGLETYAVVGTQYDVVTVTDDCGLSPSVLNVYKISGTTVYEDDATWWKSNGEGGVYTQSKPVEPPDDNGDGDGGGDPDPDPDPECPQEGTEIGRQEIETQNGTWDVAGYSGSYLATTVFRKTYADGYCSSYEGSDEYEYMPADEVIANVTEGQASYVVYATGNGNWTYSTTWNDQGDDWGVNTNEDTPDGNYDFPNADCPPAGSFKVMGGSIVGSRRERLVTVPLPSGVYLHSITALGGAMPPNSLTVRTGDQWFGRFVADGNCNWTSEAPNIPATWKSPNVCFPSGYYSNKHTIVPNQYLWVFSEFDKIEGNVKKFKAYRAYVYHDGEGNVSIQQAG
jgi:hypothetical protein